ncbi:thioredoxin domain-containing protein [Ignavibacteriales bacterium]
MAERRPNRLIHEKSPYLLQHANNPVDWYPWGEEAFMKALKEDKPVFLSIGYSTCHWCHVMEKESFEDAVVADIMNKNFVPVKVDREERPDIDSIYMAVCQMIAGSGGWPLTVIIKPDKKPFFAGTYFPKESRHGRMGLIDLLNKVISLWNERRSEIDASASQITAALNETPSPANGNNPGLEDFHTAYSQFESRFDPAHGGFGSAPKFPSPHNLIFLLRYYVLTGKTKALEMAEKTLISMRLGGIYDHLGNGFHRYSTDEEWRLPHFEKMLYDQAMLMYAYSSAYKVTGDNFYKEVISEIFQYVKTDLSSDEGGWLSAEDADSDGEEGKFYVWSYDELKEYFDDDFENFREIFFVDERGNFVDRIRGGYTGENVIHLSEPLEFTAKRLGKPVEWVAEKVEGYKSRLLEERNKRIRPHLDDKILADWNGLMIAALAFAGRTTKEQLFTKAAEDTVNFIEKYMVVNGALFHRYRQKDIAIPAFLDDLAFYSFGLLELYKSTYDSKYLALALKYAQTLINGFHDKKNGGFYLTSSTAEKLPARWKDVYDGAIPSGNSVALNVMNSLYHFTGEPIYLGLTEEIINTFSGNINKAPFAHSFLLSSIESLFFPAYELVIAGEREHPEIKSALVELGKSAYENVFVILKDEHNSKRIEEIAPFTSEMKAGEGGSSFYLCKKTACLLPVVTAAELFANLEK